MTKSNDNLCRCSLCGMALIAEESTNHSCFKPKDVWVIEGKILVGDGTRYYRWFSPTQNEQPDRNNRKRNRISTSCNICNL